jgi:glycosyltransferase involved in cell wall biosynthesis
MKKLSILYVSHAIENEGGAEISLKTFATQFKEAGHKVTYAALSPYKEFKTYVFKKFKPIYTWEGYENYLVTFLREVIQKEKPDVIHANDRFSIIPAVIAAKKERVPIVANFRDYCFMITTLGYPYDPKTGFLKSFKLKDVFRTSPPSRWLWELYRYSYIRRRYKVINQADAKICNSHAVADWGKKVGMKDPIVIHNAIDLKIPKKILSREKIRKEFGIPKDAKVIAFLSAFNVGKGVDMIFNLIEKSSELGDPYFLIAGTGAQREKMLEIAKKNKNVIYNGGKLPHNQVYKAYKAADVFLLPSKYEPFSRTIVESISTGTPVVSSNSGGGKEVIIEGKTGFLVNADKTDEWINAINKLFKTDLYKKNKKEFERIAKDYSSESAFRDLYEVYQDIIAGRKPSSKR